MMKSGRDTDEMKCPKCGRFDLRETPEGVKCKICGYTLSPGEVDKFRLFRLLREESGKKSRSFPR